MRRHAHHSEISRRDLLRAGGLGAAGLTLFGASGCELGGLGESEAAERPNLVLVIIDSVRTDHVGAYGGTRAQTPNLDAFASESLRFTRARPESMPTVPARRAMMTGRRAFPFRGWDKEKLEGLTGGPGVEPISDDQVILSEVLKRAGYRTAYVTDNPHLLAQAYDPFRRRWDVHREIPGQIPLRNRPTETISDSELEGWWPPELSDQPGAGRLRDYLTVNTRSREDEYLPARVFRAGIDVLEQLAGKRKPFALVVDSFDPHEPWDPPHRFLRKYADVRPGRPQPIQPFKTPSGFASRLKPATLARAHALYAAEVTFSDHWFGNLLDRVDSLGLSDNTWVVALSDHGIQLGERDIIGKSHSNLHRELWSIPFMIRHPERAGAGTTSDYLASTHDVTPTLLGAAGLRTPREMEGEDLTVLFGEGTPRRRTFTTSAIKDWVVTIDERWVMMCNNKGGEAKLYDRRADPRELRDVAAANPAEVARLYRRIAADAGGSLPNLF